MRILVAVPVMLSLLVSMPPAAGSTFCTAELVELRGELVDMNNWRYRARGSHVCTGLVEGKLFANGAFVGFCGGLNNLGLRCESSASQSVTRGNCVTLIAESHSLLSVSRSAPRTLCMD